MMRKHADRVYCSRCNNGLHNEYSYNEENNTVTLITRRCKGEVFDQTFGTKKKKNDDIVKCECNCQTHYIYKGHPIPIGQKPPKDLVKRDLMPKAKPLTPELTKMMSEYRASRGVPEPLVPNKFLGVHGGKGEPKDRLITSDEQENVGGGYVFKDNLDSLKKK